MTDKAIELDEHRGMAAQKATDLRRLLAEVEANEAALRRRQDELEAHLIAAPAANWQEAAGKARYLLNLFAATLSAQDPAGKRSSRPCSLIFSGSRPNLSAQFRRAVYAGPNMEDLLTAVGFNRVSASWHSIFPIEAALTTRHGGPCGFGDMMARWRLSFS